ncbi:hypothetical protein G6011_09496 [Alternaria panax]|uniref:Uncharacterized protein n=1 Tax=Alternaria panax TaxID=48097 RepID=A0AAD4NP62_9PLEO|nr:hypothetical protein G6011_09496 [Alternaria panax]
MRTVTDELVVCGVSSNIREPFPNVIIETEVDYTPGTGHVSPTSLFRLGLLSDASIALRREGSALEISGPARCEPPALAAPRARQHALDESTEGTVKGLLGAPTVSRISHGPANQPSTAKLLKTLPNSIRSRASSLDEPRPLLFHWKFPVGKRYRIADQATFATLKEKKIEWYVTTGVMVEDCTGVRWNAGTYEYLLYWHVEGMPTPEDVEAVGKGLKIDREFMRDWHKWKWEAEFGEAVMDVDDEPATPIVEEMKLPLSPLRKVRSRPPTPSCERSLPPGCKSALRRHSQDGSPAPRSLSMMLDPGSGSPKREKKVKFHRKRLVLMEVDDESVPVEEQGRIVETKEDEIGDLSDNEGRSARKSSMAKRMGW